MKNLPKTLSQSKNEYVIILPTKEGDNMNNELYQKALDTRFLYRAGKITREEAMEQMQPYVEYYNMTVKRIAQKYNRKPKLFSFTAFMR